MCEGWSKSILHAGVWGRLPHALFALGAWVAVLQFSDKPKADASETTLHPWQLIEGKYWQISTPVGEEPGATDDAEGTRGRCAAGMVEVQGRMMAAGWGSLDMVDFLQRSTCIDWIDRTFPERCALFDERRWSVLSKNIPTEPMHFCVDRFEYPNRRNAYPWIMVTWKEAAEICARDAKRLCTEAEWTFACEGEAATPYPNGYKRDPETCVIDRTPREVNEGALAPRDSERALAELDYLWQGEPAGARPGCRSPFGVYDMTGNVDEWTTSAVPGERPSVLKGGYWGPVRARCRASTRVHGEDFAFYQQGFRCCADASGTRANPVP